MMSTPLPPIYRDIRRLLVHTEEMVRRFARYHKYTVGTDFNNGNVNNNNRNNSNPVRLVRAGEWSVVRW